MAAAPESYDSYIPAGNAVKFDLRKTITLTMKSCKHNHLILAAGNKTRLRCVHCHLTINPDEIKNGYCPECYAEKGVKRYDFEEIKIEHTTRYRCEECGAFIECE